MEPENRNAQDLEHKDLEHRLGVVTNWGIWGSFGMGLVLCGFRGSSYRLGLCGFACLAAGFVCHLIVNRVYDRDFREGEIATAFGIFGVAILGFVASWLFDPAFGHDDVLLGLTGCSVTVVGIFAYVATRYGLRGSFSMFHHLKRPSENRLG